MPASEPASAAQPANGHGDPQRTPNAVSIQTPEAPQSLDDLLRSPHNPAYASGNGVPPHSTNLSASPARDERRWNGFHLWRTESEDAKQARQRRAVEQHLEQVEPPSQWSQVGKRMAESMHNLTSRSMLSIYRHTDQVDFRSDRLHTDTDDEGDDRDDPSQDAEAKLTSFGLMVLTVSLAGAQLAWTLELAYGTPYLLSLGLKEQSTSLVWLAGPLSGLIAQPVIGSLSDKSTSSFRRRKFMIASAALLTVSTLVLAYSVPLSTLLVDLFGGGLADWDPRRDSLVRTVTQWISVIAFWILDFALNGLQAASRALILDIAPSSQQSVANAWHGRMTHAGNVVGYLCGWLDLGRWKGLRWLGGGQFRRFAVVSLLGMLACVTATVTAIKESVPLRHGPAHRPSLLEQARGTLDNVWQTIRRLPRPVRRVCMVQLFAYMGWFPFLFYSTTFVQQIDGATVKARSHDSGADTKAERGSFAMLMFALVALASGALLPYLSLARERRSGAIALREDIDGERPLDDDAEAHGQLDPELEASMRAMHASDAMTLGERIRRGIRHGLTLRTLWTLASLLFAVLMVATFFVETVQQATLVIALVGVPWSVATWAPFAMVAEFVREAEDGQSPFEFDGDHWSPRRTQARVKARRRSSLMRSGEFTRGRRGLVEGANGEQDVKARLSAALVDCEPLRGSSQSPLRRETGSLVARGGESVASLRPVQQVRTETGLTAETEDGDWENALVGAGEDEEPKFGGTILGIHNLAIVAPQFVVAIISALIFSAVERGNRGGSGPSMMLQLGLSPGLVETLQRGGDKPAEGVAWVLRFGGMMAVFAAFATRFVPLTATERSRRGETTLGGSGGTRGGTDEGEGGSEDGL
ncbi:uncharacterized protein PFL1_01956 [Pseudozyma flocculosa PF-1]|uniref:Related to General alpha-glucoside permease n=1 Tax=Pseudozyma flocculosa TaxID=84751 RepID=A0A5C3F1B4_9BASI|nr:uncharacterized protein PFL1_01956 [Pseudozyma flocculosa PF-1]EPQ30430.1 hypothetical protein PFL1_01956 [Pseudozyma flocculosa PF-1]SPO37507.1 related to General alpha-glucoside permease [Pseudozyma flocculosa]